jgi:hypothetical protein
MAKKITFGDLRQLLREHGFEETPMDGPYVVFRHDASGALQAFRTHRSLEPVDPMTLASVRKTLVGFGFMTETNFEIAVQQVSQRKGPARKR